MGRGTTLASTPPPASRAPPLRGIREGEEERCVLMSSLRLRHDARYGFGARQPFGYFLRASSSDTVPAMMTSSPCRQLAGVATWCLAVSCSESMIRSTSSKLRPVDMG